MKKGDCSHCWEPLAEHAAGMQLDACLHEARGRDCQKGAPRGNLSDGLWCSVCGKNWDAEHLRHAPPYSTSWEEAGRLLEAARQNGVLPSFRVVTDGNRDWWEVRLGEVVAVGETLPEAAARAVLLVKEGR